MFNRKPGRGTRSEAEYMFDLFIADKSATRDQCVHLYNEIVGRDRDRLNALLRRFPGSVTETVIVDVPKPAYSATSKWGKRDAQ